MKRGVILALCVIYLAPLILGLSGVSPASYNIDFEPNLKQEFTFVYSFDKGTKIEAYINEGVFSEYVTIKSQEYQFGKKVVVVELKLPAEVEIPGLHRIRIGTRPIVSQKQGVMVVVDAGGIIKLRVPYPGKYAEISLNTGFANAGNDIPYSLIINSRGKEDLQVQPRLEIRNINNELINTIHLTERKIKSSEGFTYEGLIKTLNYQPGDYNLTAVVEFGGEKPTIATKKFRLGELKIEISNFTKEIESEKLNRFKVEIESFWNDPIQGVYSTMNVVGYPEKIIQTPSITLKPWEKKTLIGYVDTTGIEAERIQIQLNVYYANKTTMEVVEVKILQKTDWLFIGIVVGVIIAVILVLSLIIIIITLLIKLKYPKNKKKAINKNEK